MRTRKHLSRDQGKTPHARQSPARPVVNGGLDGGLGGRFRRMPAGGVRIGVAKYKGQPRLTLDVGDDKALHDKAKSIPEARYFAPEKGKPKRWHLPVAHHGKVYDAFAGHAVGVSEVAARYVDAFRASGSESAGARREVKGRDPGGA